MTDHFIYNREQDNIGFDEAWELWERVKHRSKDGFVPDTSQRIDELYKRVPAIMHLLKTFYEELYGKTSL